MIPIAGIVRISAGEGSGHFVGGVKERPIAHKLGVGFCDHNHERKEALAGFVGMINFAREVHASVMSPVWRFVPRNAGSRSLKRRLIKGEISVMKAHAEAYVSTTNACKLCKPLERPWRFEE